MFRKCQKPALYLGKGWQWGQPKTTTNITMCDKKCKCGPTQPLTVGELQKALNECGLVYTKNETLRYKEVVFDFPNQAPHHFKSEDGRLLLVPQDGGKRYYSTVFDVRIQMAIDRGQESEPVWVDTPRSSDRSPKAPKDSQAKIGVVGVKDNGQEIILITAYLG